MMQDGGYRHLPMVEGRKIVGIVSRGDFTGQERPRLDEETGLWSSEIPCSRRAHRSDVLPGRLFRLDVMDGGFRSEGPDPAVIYACRVPGSDGGHSTPCGVE